jgi:hypothetical protein
MNDATGEATRNGPCLDRRSRFRI